MSPRDWKLYRDFSLKIEPAEVGAYRVDVQGPTGGEGQATFVLPFDSKDLEIFLLKVGRPRRIGNRGRIEQPAQPTVDFGEKLFKAVFKDEVRDVFIKARNEAELNDCGLRLRLRLAGVPELADLPWEYLYERPNFLALSTITPLVRYIDLPNPPRPMAVTLPLRLLVTVSSPHGLPELDVDREREKIQTALAGPIQDQNLELGFSSDATLQSLQRTLRQARSQGCPYHVWHFIGHGVFDDAYQMGQLALCDVSGRVSPANGMQLGTLFGDYPELRLVLLNACEGARNSRQDPFTGVATALVERDIPAVIGMQFEISDEAAIIFSEEFYTALVDGLPVDAAMTEARRSIFFMPNWVEWATPVLFMRSADGMLFKIQRRPSREQVEKKVVQEAGPGRFKEEQAEAEPFVMEQTEWKRLPTVEAEQEQPAQESARAEFFARGQTKAERLAVEAGEQEHPAREQGYVKRLELYALTLWRKQHRIAGIFIFLLLIIFVSWNLIFGAFQGWPRQASIQIPDKLIQPEDLIYQGAFSYPNSDGWSWGGHALAYHPKGDPNGAADGYPGSLYAAGHPDQDLVGEISIPAPVIADNIEDLPVASVLKPLMDITGGWKDNCTFSEGCQFGGVDGLEFLLNIDKVVWNLRGSYESTGLDIGSLGWSNPDMASAQGVWHIGKRPSNNNVFHSSKTSNYLFLAPENFANQVLDGKWLIAGNGREAGGTSSQGPTLYALAPWKDGNPPTSGQNLGALALVYYPYIYPECMDDPTQCYFPDYRTSDQWTGGAWVQTREKTGILIFGKKALGKNCEGTPDGCGGDPCNRYAGLHAYPYEPQVLFYNPQKLIEVVAGRQEPWKVLPYAVYRPVNEVLDRECTELSSVAYDQERGFIYVAENLGEPWGSIVVHVWKVE